MATLRPSRITRRLIQLASLGLAGLIAGLLSGCTAADRPVLEHNDTGWHTASTYASATSVLSPRDAQGAGRPRLCTAGPCASHPGADRAARSPHRSM